MQCAANGHMEHCWVMTLSSGIPAMSGPDFDTDESWFRPELGGLKRGNV